MGIIIGLLIGLIGGGAVAYYVQNILLKKKKEQIVYDAEAEGESIKKEKLLQAKEQFFKLKEDDVILKVVKAIYIKTIKYFKYYLTK